MIPEKIKQELRRSYIEAGCWKNETFSSKLSELSERFGERIAVTDGKRSLSYNDLNSIASRGARFFYENGIMPKDKVIVQLPNSIEFAETVFALFRLGAIPVFALPGHREKEISAFISSTSAKAYVLCRSY